MTSACSPASTRCSLPTCNASAASPGGRKKARHNLPVNNKRVTPGTGTACKAHHNCATTTNLPRRAILSDRQIITIAQKRPSAPENLAEYLAPDHLLWQELPYLAQRFSDNTPPPAPPASPRLSPAKRQHYEQLCAYTADTAAALNIHPDMLAPTRVLKNYVAKPDPTSPLLTGWRAAFFREPLGKLL